MRPRVRLEGVFSSHNCVCRAAFILFLAPGVCASAGQPPRDNGLAARFGTAWVPPSGKELAPINACAFLRQSDIQRILPVISTAGVRDDDGRTSDGAYSSTCVWRFASRAEGPLKGMILVNAMRWPDAGSSGKFLQAFRTAAADHTIEHQPVPVAAGDEALWWGDGVAVRVGPVSFGVSVMLTEKGTVDRRNITEALARQIVAKGIDSSPEYRSKE
jgi:hypothetical protein